MQEQKLEGCRRDTSWDLLGSESLGYVSNSESQVRPRRSHGGGDLAPRGFVAFGMNNTLGAQTRYLLPQLFLPHLRQLHFPGILQARVVKELPRLTQVEPELEPEVLKMMFSTSQWRRMKMFK